MRLTNIHQLEPLQVDCLSTGLTEFEVVESVHPAYAFLGFRAVVFKTDANTTVEPVIDIGFNDPDYNNLASGVTIASQVTQNIDLLPAHMGSPTTIKINVTTPATADSFSISVFIFLFYLPT